jgi:hypothetical protein
VLCDRPVDADIRRREAVQELDRAVKKIEWFYRKRQG